jgi:hypothetical protein
MSQSFWSNDPTILFNKEYVFELWPTENMCYEQKLNAITRLILLITLLGYIATMSTRILFTGFVTLAVIFLYFKIRKQKITREMVEEGFSVAEGTGSVSSEYKYLGRSTSFGAKTTINPVTLDEVVRDEFKEGNKRNPFSNVLLTEIMDEPDRKSAPPAFNPDIDEDITKNIKKSVQFMNPGIKNTNKQLYGDLFERWELDQSDRAFYSTANTRVANDQGAFGQYLYGYMPSSHDSTTEGALARTQDSFRYTLY